MIGDVGGAGGSWISSEVVVAVSDGWGWKVRESRLVDGLSVVVSIIDFDGGK